MPVTIADVSELNPTTGNRAARVGRTETEVAPLKTFPYYKLIPETSAMFINYASAPTSPPSSYRDAFYNDRQFPPYIFMKPKTGVEGNGIGKISVIFTGGETAVSLQFPPYKFRSVESISQGTVSLDYKGSAVTLLQYWS
jgi:hypothetical protein